MKSKVVGTTYHTLPKGANFVPNNTIEDASIIERFVNCQLVPEPTNEYDPTAIKVETELSDGSLFTVGYLAKGDPNKEFITSPTLAKLTITSFKRAGYNDSYVVSFDSDEVMPYD